jgi:cell division protein FtsL
MFSIIINIIITASIILLFHLLWNYISSYTPIKEINPTNTKIEKYKKMVEELDIIPITTHDELSQDLDNYIHELM